MKQALPPIFSTNTPRGKILSAARMAALEAGTVIKNNYTRPHKIHHKGRIDIVTETDLAAESKILDILYGFDPNITIISEESHSDFSCQPETPVWIIDPLDGTTNFAHGFPYFAVSIAYFHTAENTKAGLIYCPMQDELFSAVSNEGAWLNDTPINVSQTAELENALIATGFPYSIDRNLDMVLYQFQQVLPRVQDIRRAGAAAVDLAYLACGRIDGFWEMELKPWDTAAAQIIIEEAGGVLNTFTGERFSPFFPEVLASNQKLQAKLLDLISI